MCRKEILRADTVLTLLRMKYLQMKKRQTDTMPARIGEINHDNTTDINTTNSVYKAFQK